MSKASLLGLPPELRYTIYELAFPSVIQERKYRVRGTLSDIPGQLSQAEADANPWVLTRSCKTIRQELEKVIPPLEKIRFSFNDLTPTEFRSEMSQLGAANVRRIRIFTLHGWAKCRSRLDENFHRIWNSNKPHACGSEGPYAEMSDPCDWRHAICWESSMEDDWKGMITCEKNCGKDSWCQRARSMWLEKAGYCRREMESDLNKVQRLVIEPIIASFWRSDGAAEEAGGTRDQHDEKERVALRELFERFLLISGHLSNMIWCDNNIELGLCDDEPLSYCCFYQTDRLEQGGSQTNTNCTVQFI